MTTRIRWINPLGVTGFDQPIADTIAAVKEPDTEVEVVSLALPEPIAHVEYRAYEALTYGEIVRLAYEGGRSGYDAMVIGCFYDPALKEAREVSGEMVVVAPCMAAVQVALTLANRFSVIIGRRKWEEQMTECVRANGAGHNLASMRSIDMGVEQLQADHKETERRIIEAARLAVREDHAEAVILGCTGEYGFHDVVQREVGVPVIDAVCAPFKLAEHMANLKRRMGWRPSRVHSCESPPMHEIERFGLFRQRPAIANTIVIPAGARRTAAAAAE
jgi:allantoin racemase